MLILVHMSLQFRAEVDVAAYSLRHFPQEVEH